MAIEDARPSRVQIRAEMRVERRQERIAAGIEEVGTREGARRMHNARNNMWDHVPRDVT